MKPYRRWQPYVFLAPTVLILGLFFVYPVILAVYRSFFRWDLLTPPVYVGRAHYQALAESGALWATTLRTLAFSGMVVVGATALGLLLAVLLSRPGKVFAWIRGAIFSAYMVSWVSVGLLWLWILDGDSGVVSRLSQALGFGGVSLLSDPDLALITLAGVTIWKITGYAMVIFMAGLRDVPKSVLEAARLDGASSWQRFRLITWPLLRPTTAFVVSTSLILGFQAFDVVRVMTQGGPVNSTTVFVYAIYEQVFLNLRVGRASALTVVFFLILVGLTLLQLWAWRLARRSPASEVEA